MTKLLYKNHFLIIIIILASVNINIAQIKNTVANGWVFEDFEKDLSQVQKIIYTLTQDSNGFIWMGTMNGINVYDGKNFQFYKDYHDDILGFKGQRVQHILEDSKGRILIATGRNGINVFMPETGKFINYKDDLFKNTNTDYISTISENSKGKLFVASDLVITFRLNENGELINRQVYKPDLENEEIILHGFIYNDDYFIVTNKRIISFETKSTVFKTNKIRLCKVRNDKIWILEDTRLGTIDLKSGHFEPIGYDFPKSDGFPHDFDFLSPEIAFIGTVKGLLQVNLNESSKANNTSRLIVKEYNRHGEKISVGVSRIFKDKMGSLYFNFRGNYGGLMKLNKNQLNYKYIGLPEPYNKERYIANVFHDSFGLYWLNTPYGLFAYNSIQNDFHRFSNDSIMAFNGTDSSGILEDSKNQLWLNTNKGIIGFNRPSNSFKIYEKPAGNNSAYYPSVFFDNKDQLWYPSKKGVSKFNTINKTHTDFNIGEPSAIFLDKKNTLWVNIQNEALYAYNISNDSLEIKETYKEFFSTINTRLFHSPVRQIQSDHLDRLWITGFNGIYVYDYKNREIVKHFNKKNLLADDNIFATLKDANGNFWVKQYRTEAFCIDSESLEVIETLPRWMNIIPTLRGNSGLIYQDKNGQMFTNGIDGCFVFDPTKITTNALPIRVVLTGLSINGEVSYSNFTGTQNLNPYHLKYDKNTIEIDIKEVGQNNSPQKEFAYRMKGISDEWQFSKKLQPLNYNNLQPNSYTLEVKSTSDGKHWSEPLTLASFEIVPPWWKTVYAYLAYTILIAILLFAFYRLQLNRKLAESESQKLKEVDDFKNKFFQNITHEFRTPLTVINGMAENVNDKASKVIKRNSKQLLRLVNELLEIGKIESNTSKLNISNQDIVKFIRYCVESLESLTIRKEIDLKFISNKEEQFLDFDSDKIQLVINNLISNAIKFTPEHGKIEVEIEINDSFVEIHVKDTGPGIPLEDLDLIFDRYFQSKNKRTSAGTGIGLALSREIIKLMNGSISATNNEDVGACLSLKLPLINSESDVNNGTVSIKGNLGNSESEEIILVIEDNEDVLNYIISILQDQYQVHTAPNGKIGYQKAIDIIPDLIITDVMMPVMDGFEACSLIKTDFKTNHIPVIMLTAKADIDSKISGLKTGADVYLGKPFNRKELLTHINNLIILRENLKQKYSQMLSEENITHPENTDPFIDKLTDLLLKNLSDGSFGIEDVCKELGVSRTQLHRKLKALTGLSTSIFIRDIRLREGYKMLKNTNHNVSEVAYSVGFNDPFYFSKLFTEKFDIPPSRIEK
ncbi:ATP-binding protein [Seonamhaeicola sp. MEBiC1930]|uniref:ATP-binding protein n=1 Tax=Seonamhaeicola sp. MEBiC01930 TaxID=2976768 RepID=UPI003255C90C